LVALPVPLSPIKNGPVADSASPHGLTRFVSVWFAAAWFESPASPVRAVWLSVTRFVWMKLVGSDGGAGDPRAGVAHAVTSIPPASPTAATAAKRRTGISLVLVDVRVG